MTSGEKMQIRSIHTLVANAIDCLTANPPRRGAADYLLSARQELGEVLDKPERKAASKTNGND